MWRHAKDEQPGFVFPLPPYRGRSRSLLKQHEMLAMFMHVLRPPLEGDIMAVLIVAAYVAFTAIGLRLYVRFT